MYADDTSLIFTNGDINELDNAMASDLKCVNIWLNANKLTLISIYQISG